MVISHLGIYELLGSASTGAYRDRRLTSRNASLSPLPAVALLRAPFQFEMLDCGIVSPRASIVAGHRGENTTDEVRPVARCAPARRTWQCAGRRERNSLSACLSVTDCVEAQLHRAVVPTQRTMPPSRRGSGATVGVEHRRRRRRWKLSLRVAKRAASCATADASLSMGCPFRA